ncbi:pyroglutamyl-peptidase I [Alkalihalobacterium alkalinitrilicum]|uniref:pyroglutamyl-peptidase I n=1 Tax=Alkalihalobacterium alkalinitrilicum TaxID=427920 RepID=UPI000994AD7D|nr:pyroglutamyl-peptidase I [Alkalihalobacterium alkalinitrilicum]
MKVLLSGFEPFGDFNVNPTLEIVKALKNQGVEGVEIETIGLPVVYGQCVDTLLIKMEEINPDVVISCGLAFGRAAITPERIGINVQDTAGEGDKGDNQGDKPVDRTIFSDGPDGLFTTLPIRNMVERLVSEGIPAQISNTAGTYICNNTLYGVLHHIQQNELNIKAGFVHFPATPDMVTTRPNIPSMSLNEQIRSLKVMVEAIRDHE